MLDYISLINGATTIAQLEDLRFGANGFETQYNVVHDENIFSYDDYMRFYDAYIARWYQIAAEPPPPASSSTPWWVWLGGLFGLAWVFKKK